MTRLALCLVASLGCGSTPDEQPCAEKDHGAGNLAATAAYVSRAKDLSESGDFDSAGTSCPALKVTLYADAPTERSLANGALYAPDGPALDTGHAGDGSPAIFHVPAATYLVCFGERDVVTVPACERVTLGSERVVLTMMQDSDLLRFSTR